MYQFYKMNSNTSLLYLKNKSYFDKFYISKKSQKRILQYDHDEHVHEDIHRIYNVLHRLIFMFKMRQLIKIYDIVCSICQLSKFSRQFFYEKLNFIEFSKEFLTKLSLDSVVTLFMTIERNNAIMSTIDRFSKYVKIVLEKETFFVKNWDVLY